MLVEESASDETSDGDDETKMEISKVTVETNKNIRRQKNTVKLTAS